MKRSQPSREANIWVARGVPLFLLGLAGYASWTVTKVLCVDYLLRPSSTSAFDRPQYGPAAAILVIYYIFFLMMLVCYLRLLYVVTRHPGLVPRGPQWYSQKQKNEPSDRPTSKKHHRGVSQEPKVLDSDISDASRTSEAVTNNVATEASLRVGDFWQREVFTCGPDGRPPFCSTCYNWKPDRAHHCSELDRCVLKMDHFCPWVGGVVGETSFKFFTQFTFWGALYCASALIPIAYYFAQRRSVEGVTNVHWAVVIGISSLFLLFSGGMCLSSVQFAFINSTTIENLSRKRKVWYLAVHVPEHVLQEVEQRGRSNLRFITYPRPAAEQFQMFEQNSAETSPDTLRSDMHLEANSGPKRTFAVLETAPGTNPFDLGWKHNFLDMMGSNPYEWLFPVHSSPYVKHQSNESFYKMGSAVHQLKLEARLVDGSRGNADQRKPPKHRRRRKSSTSHSRSRSRSRSTTHPRVSIVRNNEA